MEGEEGQKKQDAEETEPDKGVDSSQEGPSPAAAEPPPEKPKSAAELTKPSAEAIPPAKSKSALEGAKAPPAEAEPPPADAEPPPEKPKSAVGVRDEPEPTKAPSAQPSSQPVGKSGSALRSSDQRSRMSEKSVVLNEASDKQPPPRKGLASVAALTSGNFSCATFFQKRSPFVHNPPQPEERRERIENPRTPREYIINLREDLADFQESHGLPRTRDYSFMSLGMALAQETARALCSLFLMFAELFPIVAIVSLIMRFALDKLIEILETDEPVPKAKKSILFALQMLVIIIPLWILIGTIIIPLITLMFSIVRRMFRFKGRKCSSGTKSGRTTCSAFDYLRFF